jgi:hypothetical protein
MGQAQPSSSLQVLFHSLRQLPLWPCFYLTGKETEARRGYVTWLRSDRRADKVSVPSGCRSGLSQNRDSASI